MAARVERAAGHTITTAAGGVGVTGVELPQADASRPVTTIAVLTEVTRRMQCTNYR
jgi:hypothetical protein